MGRAFAAIRPRERCAGRRDGALGWRAPSGTLLSTLALALLLWPAAARAQEASTGATSPAATTDPTVLAKTVSTRSPIQTAGQPESATFFDLGLNSSTGYTDDVSGAAGGGGSVFQILGGNLDAGQQRGGLNWELSYAPNYEIYQNDQGYNQLNQSGAAQVSQQLGDHWYLRAGDAVSYGRYLYNSAALNGLSSGAASGALNLGVATPLARQYSQSPTVELEDVINYRSSFTLSGDYMAHRFLGAAASSGLSDVRGAGGAATYSYRFTPRSSVGLTYSYDHSVFAEGVARMTEQSAQASWTHVLNPTTSVMVGGGPQRVNEQENLTAIFGPPVAGVSAPSLQPVRTYFAAEAAINHQTGRAALTLSAQRGVSDSGGLIASGVVQNSVTGGVGEEFGGVWHAQGSLTYELLTAANLTHTTGNYQGVIAAFSMGRALGQAWEISLAGASSRQKRNGNVPYASGYRSDSISFGISYHWHRGR